LEHQGTDGKIVLKWISAQ